MLIHATCVALGDHAVLLRGPSGAGKSDLALRLLEAGAQLVADDQVALRAAAGRLLAAPPAQLAGWMEVRGLGILPFPHRAEAVVACVIELVERAAVERLPEPDSVRLLDFALPLFRLHAHDLSAPRKVQLAVRLATGDIIPLP